MLPRALVLLSIVSLAFPPTAWAGGSGSELFRLEYHRRLGEAKKSTDPEKWRDLAEWLEKSRASYVGQGWVRSARDRVRELELGTIKKDDADGYLELAKKLEKEDGERSAFVVLELGLKHNPAGKALVEKLMTLEVKGRLPVLERYYEALKDRAEQTFDAAAFAEFADWCSQYGRLDKRIKDWVLHCHTRASALAVFSAPDPIEGVEGTAAGTERERTRQEELDEENPVAAEAIAEACRLSEQPLDRQTFLPRIPGPKHQKKPLKATDIEILLQKDYRLIKGGVRTYSSSPPDPNAGFQEVWKLLKRPDLATRSGGRGSTEPVWMRVKWDSQVHSWQVETQAEKQQDRLKKIEFVRAKIAKLVGEVDRRKSQVESQVLGMEKAEDDLRAVIQSGADEKKTAATRGRLLRAARGVYKARNRLGKWEFRLDAWKRELVTLETGQ